MGVLMNKPIELRFIPKWLSGSIEHYGTNVKDFESIVSPHDIGLYYVANHLLRSRFKALGIDDFVFPAADKVGQFSADDAVFALYGSDQKDATVPQFELGHFVIVPDSYDGIVLIEKDGAEKKDLIRELLTALATYRGRAVAYESKSFNKFLSSVNKNSGASKSQVMTTSKELENDDAKP
jgi:hypothetical protein